MSRFIPNLSTLVKPLTSMLKKNMVFNCTKEGKDSSEAIKQETSQASTLVNPNYDKDFILYTFGGEASISVVLTQLNKETLQHPIAFFSEGLKDYEVKYSYIEKQALVFVRALKKFRHMLSNNRIQLMVPHAIIQEFLLSRDINKKRVGWITRVMEYDVDIKITKLVRGKGLCEKLVSTFETPMEVSLVL